MIKNGLKTRLVVKFNYPYRLGYIRFIPVKVMGVLSLPLHNKPGHKPEHAVVMARGGGRAELRDSMQSLSDEYFAD